MAGQFNLEYRFHASNIKVVMKHPKGQFLRINPNDHNQLNENGGVGKWAQWEIQHHGTDNAGLKLIKLKHTASNKYLRILQDGRINVGGGGGKWTVFKVHSTGAHSAKLESNQCPGKYVAVQPKGPAVGSGGKWTQFHFYRQAFNDNKEHNKHQHGHGHKKGKNKFNVEYTFKQSTMVILKHPKGQNLRIKPNDHATVDEHGGCGRFARWNIEFNGDINGFKIIKLKHNLSGKYLRIMPNGKDVNVGGGGGKWTRFKLHSTGSNSAKLESVEIPNKYVAVQPQGPAVGSGGKWCLFHFFSQGIGNDNKIQMIHNKYNYVEAEAEAEGKNDEYTYSTNGDEECISNDNNSSEWISLLAKWDLKQFIIDFESAGWTHPIDWTHINDIDLSNMGLHKGHIVRFNREFRKYYNKNDQELFNKNDNNKMAIKLDPVSDIINNANNGTIFALRSVSSNRYLDGRDNEANPLMTARNPKDDTYLNWTVIKTSSGWALKSVSGGNYLDGRGGQQDPLMTNRNPMNDKYLQWTFQKTNGGQDNVAIKSVSSGRYLDGRGGQTNPLMTARNPMDDKYLQWIFERM